MNNPELCRIPSSNALSLDKRPQYVCLTSSATYIDENHLRYCPLKLFFLLSTPHGPALIAAICFSLTFPCFFIYK